MISFLHQPPVYFSNWVYMSIFLWSTRLSLRPSHLWVRKRSRRHRIDESVGAGCRSSGLPALGHDPHKALWTGWWGTGPSHQPTSRHCTSSDLPSRTAGAVQRWPVCRPVPHRPAGLPGNSTGNGHGDAGRGTPPLGVGILLNKVLWRLSLCFRSVNSLPYKRYILVIQHQCIYILLLILLWSLNLYLNVLLGGKNTSAAGDTDLKTVIFLF